MPAPHRYPSLVDERVQGQLQDARGRGDLWCAQGPLRTWRDVPTTSGDYRTRNNVSSQILSTAQIVAENTQLLLIQARGTRNASKRIFYRGELSSML